MKSTKARDKKGKKFITAPLKFNVGTLNYEVDFEKLKKKKQKS